MPLKDWTTTGVPNRWRKNGMIVNVSLAKSDFHYLTIPAWNTSVKHERSNTYFADEIFPNKAKALAFAKKYMRSH